MEFSLGSTEDRRTELLLEDASEDLLLEELLPKRFIIFAYNHYKKKTHP
jgi:hypothetical protein